MAKKEQILELLNAYKSEVDNFNDAIFTDKFEVLAQDIVKLFAIPVVIGSAYNERPKYRPKCPECGKKLSPAGGTLDGSEMFWACWNCDYRQEDIPSHCL